MVASAGGRAVESVVVGAGSEVVGSVVGVSVDVSGSVDVEDADGVVESDGVEESAAVVEVAAKSSATTVTTREALPALPAASVAV